MAAMASQPELSRPQITIGRVRQSSRGTTLLLWVPASVVGAVAGSLVAFEIRSWGVSLNLDAALEALRYVATIASVGLAAAAQWWVLQRGRLDAYWWVPGTVAGQLLASILIVPTVLRLFLPAPPFQSFNPSPEQTMIAGGAALAAGGVLVGGAQTLILRVSAGRAAWLWVPATALGGALAGSVSSALSIHFVALPVLVAICLGAALGALLVSSSQLVALSRLVR